MSKVTVIVPVYNSGKYLDECIQSILKQTISDLELILVNDGSLDNSAEICDRYAEKDKRVTVINKPNGGVSSARNAGLDYFYEHSGSKYITFIDSDDYITSDYVEVLYKACEDNNTKMAQATLSDNLFKNGKGSGTVKVLEPNNLFYGKKPYERYSDSPCVKLYHRDIFKEIRFPLEKIFEDNFVAHRTYFCSDRISVVDKIIYYYRQTDTDSITRRTWHHKKMQRIESYEDRLKFFQQTNNQEGIRFTYNELFHTLKTDIRFIRERSLEKDKDDYNEMLNLANKILKEHKDCIEYCKSDLYYMNNLDKNNRSTVIKYGLIILFTEGPVALVRRYLDYKN